MKNIRDNHLANGGWSANSAISSSHRKPPGIKSGSLEGTNAVFFQVNGFPKGSPHLVNLRSAICRRGSEIPREGIVIFVGRLP